MSTVVLDAETITAWSSGESALLCDAEGNIVRLFRAPLYDPALIPEFDEAELDRREAIGSIPSAGPPLVDCGEIPRRPGIPTPSASGNVAAGNRNQPFALDAMEALRSVAHLISRDHWPRSQFFRHSVISVLAI